MGLSDGRKSFPIGLAVLIQYRSVTDTQPPSHVAVAITLNAIAKASSLKMDNADLCRDFQPIIVRRIYRIGTVSSVRSCFVFENASL